MKYVLDALLNQLMAVAMLALVCTTIIGRSRSLMPRQRQGVLFLTGIAFGLHLSLLLTEVPYEEAWIAWHLRQNGVSTSARIVSVSKAGHKSRTSNHGGPVYRANCEYAIASGGIRRGVAEVPEAMPHSPGDQVAVRYLASEPDVMREEDYVVKAKQPERWLYFLLPWLVNTIAFTMLWRRIRAWTERQGFQTP